MYENLFYKRLTELRMQNGASAREMSLSLGQSPGYINKVENKQMLPSMTAFFYICEYLKVDPKDFFNDEIKNPTILNEIIIELMKLDEEQLSHYLAIIKGQNK